MFPRIDAGNALISVDPIFAWIWSFSSFDRDWIVADSMYLTGPRRMVCKISMGVLLVIEKELDTEGHEET